MPQALGSDPQSEPVGGLQGLPGRLFRGLCERLGYRLIDARELDRLQTARRSLWADVAAKRGKIAEPKLRLARRRARTALPGPGQVHERLRVPDNPAGLPEEAANEAAQLRWKTFRRVFVAEVLRAFLDGAPSRGEDPGEVGFGDGSVAAQADNLVRARALRRAGRLQPEEAVKAALALFEHGLVDEALDILLDDRCAPDEPDFGRTQLIAECWLALGALRSAREATRSAKAIAPKKPIADRLAPLEAATGLAERTGRPSLAESWGHISGGGLRRARYDAAARWVTALLEETELRTEDVDPILDVVLVLLRAADRHVAAGLFAAMSPIYMAHGRIGEFRRTLAAMRGADLSVLGTADPSPQIRPRLTACAAEALAAAGCWREAIDPFIETYREGTLANEGFSELARCVGRHVLSGFDLRLRPQASVKVFDVFPYNGEFDVLRLKLETMGPWVDHFVIVEAAATFTGQPKPLSFPERAGELGAYAEKIIYAPLEAFPPHFDFPWSREFFQRDSAVRALSGLCGPDDIVIISDADEIIAHHAVKDLRAPLTGVDLRLFNYFLNCERSQPPSLHVKSAITRGRVLATNGLSYLRLGVGIGFKDCVAARGGWHFSSLGGPAEVARKMRSYSHTENAHEAEAHYEDLIRKIRRGETAWRRCEIDEGFPIPLQSNPAAYAQHLL